MATDPVEDFYTQGSFGISGESMSESKVIAKGEMS
jgi:hypothetical protein